MKSKKIMTLVASAAIASGIAISLPTTVAHADALHHLNKPVQLVQFNKTIAGTNHDGSVTIKYKIICDGKVLGSGSATGMPGTSAKLPIPAIPKGYTLVGITVNGNSTPSLSTSIPLNFPKSNTDVVYKVVKGLNKYANNIKCTTSKGKPLAGVKMTITYSDTTQVQVVTNSEGYAPTNNKCQVINVTITGVPSGYKLVGEPYQYILTSSDLLSNGTTETAVNANFKFSKTVTPKVVTGEIKYTIETQSGEVLGGGGAKGVVGKEFKFDIKLPKGYEIVKYETSEGTPIKSLPTEITQAGETSYKIIVKSTTPPKPKPVKALLTIKEVGPDGTVYGQSGMTGFIGMQDKAVAPGLPKGFKLVNITCNGKVIDALPKTLTEANQTIIYHIERIAKPKPVISNSKITYKIVTDSGKVLGSGYGTGQVGTSINFKLPVIPKGYEIVSIKDNGIIIKSMPLKYTKGNQDIIYTIKKKAEVKPIVKPVVKPKTSNTVYNVTAKIIDKATGKLMSTTVVKGTTGTAIYGPELNIPYGYKIVSVKEDGITVSGIPKDIGNKNETLTITVVKDTPTTVPSSNPGGPSPVVKPVKPVPSGDKGGPTHVVKPVVKPVKPEPIVKPVVKPIVKPVVKPIVKPVKPTPIVKPVKPEPIVKPVVKPIVKPVEKPKVDPTPVVKPKVDPKPIVKPKVEPTHVVKPKVEPTHIIKPVPVVKPVEKHKVEPTHVIKPVEKPKVESNDKTKVKQVNNTNVAHSNGITSKSDNNINPNITHTTLGNTVKSNSGSIEPNGTVNPKTGDASEAPLAGLIAGSVLALFIANKKYILR